MLQTTEVHSLGMSFLLNGRKRFSINAMTAMLSIPYMAVLKPMERSSERQLVLVESDDGIFMDARLMRRTHTFGSRVSRM